MYRQQDFYRSQSEIDPDLWREATFAANGLANRPGMTPDEREDYRQELILDVWERRHNFDPSRGSWAGFVRGVIHNRVVELEKRERLRKRIFSPYSEFEDRVSKFEAKAFGKAATIPDLAVAWQVRRLPGHLRQVAEMLMHFNATEASKRLGKSRSRTHQWIAEIRARFKDAGLAPVAS